MERFQILTSFPKHSTACCYFTLKISSSRFIIGRTWASRSHTTFTGKGITVYTWKGGGAGSVEIFLDGASQEIFSEDNGGDDAYNQALFTKTGLSNSSHTIKLVATNVSWTMVDYLVVTH